MDDIEHRQARAGRIALLLAALGLALAAALTAGRPALLLTAGAGLAAIAACSPRWVRRLGRCLRPAQDAQRTPD